MFVVGIAGGSASGKTTLAQKLRKNLLANYNVGYLEQDCYYRDRSMVPAVERAVINYDTVEAIDFDLMLHHLKLLNEGKSVHVPQYDFTTHTRMSATTHIEPVDIIILEGILLFAHPLVRQFCNFKIFVDTPADIRLLRRICRDIKERGRDIDSVIEQYINTVRPMHELYVEPAKAGSDMVISGVKESVDEFQRLMETLLRCLGIQ